MTADMELLALTPQYHRLGDYFGLWSMYEPSFNGLFNMAAGMDLVQHVDSAKAVIIPTAKSSDSDGPGYSLLPSGIAIVSLRGSLMKSPSSFSSSTSTVRARQAVRNAGRDPDVLGALFVIESPGGTVAGTQDLAADIAALEKIKPTAAYCEDLCASAAYWCASQAGMIACNPTALVGSIGTFMSVIDSSGRAEDMKIKVHVIRAGAHKGAGTPGTQITDEHLAEYQRMVDSLNEKFLSGVATGRRMSMDAVRGIADGRVHVGDQAKQLGLVDSVQSMDDTIRQLTERAGQRSGSSSGSRKGTKMTDVTLATAAALAAPLQPQAATLDELEAHLIGADDSFKMKQLKGKVTLDQAKSNWLAEMNTRLQTAQAEAKDAKAQADATAKGGGVNPLGPGTAKAEEERSGDAVAEFDALVASCKKPGMTNLQATVVAARKNAALHRQYLTATNPASKSRRLLNEKYNN